MPDRHAVLVADEGMRILNPDGIKTNAPYFIAVNDDLWNAWRELQEQSAGGERIGFGSFWKIIARMLPNGGTVITLHIQFDPPER
jgi:hypothetical protein